MSNTKLKDRTLWYDGSSSYDPSYIFQALQQFSVKYVNALTPEIRMFNNNVSTAEELLVKQHNDNISIDWNIPEPYRSLNVVDFISTKHIELLTTIPEDEIDKREQRLSEEIIRFHTPVLLNVLRTIIWIVEVLSTHDVVWGVGRGSSVSSYLLYVIGVHDVDSFSYNLELSDFLHD